MPNVRSPSRADLALAGVLAAYALVEGLVIDAPAAWLVGAPLAMLPFAWRRAYPFAVVALVLVLVLLLGTATRHASDSVLPLPVIIACAYTAGRETASGRLALLGAAAIAAWMAIGLGFGTSPAENSGAEDLVALLVLISGAAGAGYVIRLRQAENAKLQSLTAELASQRDARARAAVAEERARVARELHDVVAHSVSLISVQAGAAEELMGRDDARAREALHAVQETARGALGEMRRLLTVLRTDDGAPELTPQPGLAAVTELVAQARGGGLPVELREEGSRGAVPAGIDLSAFRILQEALTNVRKHAGAAPTEVLVRYAPDAVEVEVSNVDPPAATTPNGDDGGYGIAGMSERARICGGTLDAGRRDGRFVVHARLPLSGAPR
ncbi:MAG: sensor histidine kinase [Actinobacteria bacterium]|nr:sensor histidine kinase [Actinomycetota bacterium]